MLNKETEISKIDMRDAFFDELYNIAKLDKRIILLSNDFGAPSLDKFRNDLKNQYFNIGISEQNMVNVAAGLALSGKIVYIYAIASFVTLRCFEQIKIDLCVMNLSVNVLGVGAGYAYDTAGTTHHATEDVSVMRALPKIIILNPTDSIMAASFAGLSSKIPGPKYIRFDRGKTPIIYDKINNDFFEGLTLLRAGIDMCIITTGLMVHKALEVSDLLAKHSIAVGVIDVYRLKPINSEYLNFLTKDIKRLITLEEHIINGGLGSIIAEILSDYEINKPLKRIAIKEENCFGYGDRKFLHKVCGLDTKSIVNKILKWKTK